MPDIDVFDPKAFFAQRIRELEQELIAKQAQCAIQQVNHQNLEQTLTTLQSLPEEQQKALQLEIVSLAEARNQTLRGLEALQGEIGAMGAKLSALKAAQALVAADQAITRPLE